MIFYIKTINNHVEDANFITSPAEALVIYRALEYLINDEDAHDDEKWIAERLIKEMKREFMNGESEE